MIIVYGIRLYGKVDACGSTHRATRFLHIWYLPLIPVGSVQLVEGGTSAIAAPFSLRSVAAGYLRTWGVLGTIGFGLGAASGFAAAGGPDLAMGLLFVLALAATILAFTILGRLSPEEKAKRLAYALEIGDPLDPAAVPALAEPLRKNLHTKIAGSIGGLAQMGYRGVADPRTQWSNVALDPDVRDRSFLNATLTLARLESAFGAPAMRAQHAQVHDQIWLRMKQLGYADLDIAAAG